MKEKSHSNVTFAMLTLDKRANWIYVHIAKLCSYFILKFELIDKCWLCMALSSQPLQWWTLLSYTWLAFQLLVLPKGTHTAVGILQSFFPLLLFFFLSFSVKLLYYTKYVHTYDVHRQSYKNWAAMSTTPSPFFSLGFFFTTKKVSSVNEKWLPFDSCPLKSRLLWYFAWHRGLRRVARDGRGGSELGEKAPF